MRVTCTATVKALTMSGTEACASSPEPITPATREIRCVVARCSACGDIRTFIRPRVNKDALRPWETIRARGATAICMELRRPPMDRFEELRDGICDGI
jgi:hypothetical protein